MDLSKNHIYQCAEIVDLDRTMSSDRCIAVVQEKLRQQIAHNLAREKADIEEMPGLTTVRVDLYVFTRKEFNMFMHEMEHKFSRK